MHTDALHTLTPGPIGVFDSGFGGLTILREIRRVMPQYDFTFLGDNARAPYGSRSFDVVYEFTRQSVRHLMMQGCPLVILACNTASAKALRTIQQSDLPTWHAAKRVLGIIRPTVERVGDFTQSRHVGILATSGTVSSESYPIEMAKIDPTIVVTQVACPMWVPLVENGEYDTPGADYFVKKKLDELLSLDPLIDTIILGCTHYPILLDAIRRHLPPSIRVISQGQIVAESLRAYLDRHSDLDRLLTKGEGCLFQTTESEEKFKASARIFLSDDSLKAEHIIL